MLKGTIKCDCIDCSVDTRKINEFYMVHRELWLTAVPDEDNAMTKFLCIGCLERRLGRKLIALDFQANVPLNWPGIRTMSDRLLSRIKSVDTF